MRLGLIGVGRIGAMHAELVRAMPKVERLLVADADPGRAAAVATDLGADAAAGVDDLLAVGSAGGLDGVLIAAPTPTHPELIAATARVGLPIFCEKPLAPDLDGTRAVIDTVNAAGVSLQVGFQRRFDPGFVAAVERLRAGELGRLHTVVSATGDPHPPDPAYLPASGGLFADCAVHDIDAIRWATGREVVEVHAVGSTAAAEAMGAGESFAAAGDVDTAQAICVLDDGTLATILATRYNGAGYEGRLELHGTAGTAAAGIEGIVQHGYAGFADRFATAYRAELQAFTELVDGTGPNRCPPEAALEALRVARACDRSRLEHRPIQVDQHDGRSDG